MGIEGNSSKGLTQLIPRENTKKSSKSEIKMLKMEENNKNLTF